MLTPALVTPVHVRRSPDEAACRGNLTDDLNSYNPLTRSTMAKANWPVTTHEWAGTHPTLKGSCP